VTDASGITLGLAFFAGLASFLSPCVFALVPAYIGYLSGRSVATLGSDKKANSLVTLSHGLAFVVGFSIVFVILGALAAALGGLLNDITDILVKLGGVVILVFGLHMVDAISIPFLNYDLRPQSSPDRKRGYLSSALMGVFFSAGWAPCVGPVLGAILTLALNGGSITQGAVLLSAYSAGLAIPFLLAATQIGWVTTVLRRYSKVMVITEKVMGFILIILGVLLFSGRFEAILAPLTGRALFNLDLQNAELVVGQLLLWAVFISLALGLIPGWYASQQGKTFLDWWFLGSGVFLVILIILYYFGMFSYLPKIFT